MEMDLAVKEKALDMEEFNKVIKLNSRKIYHVAYSYLKNVEDAADITQETFFRAFKNLSNYCQDKPIFPWLYQITKNLCLNTLKKRNRESEKDTDFCLYPSAFLGPEEAYEREFSSNSLRKAVNALPLNFREILVLKEFDGFCYEEISQILEIPIGTVMSRLFYARQKLKDLLQDKEKI